MSPVPLNVTIPGSLVLCWQQRECVRGGGVFHAGILGHITSGKYVWVGGVMNIVY
jgi:hypothetical protein